MLGPDTQYPVRARVIRGWDYEFVDLSAAYDIVVYRDVFGMLAHQIDDENVQRYRRQSRLRGPARSASPWWTRSRTRMPAVPAGAGRRTATPSWIPTA